MRDNLDRARERLEVAVGMSSVIAPQTRMCEQETVIAYALLDIAESLRRIAGQGVAGQTLTVEADNLPPGVNVSL